MKIAEIFFRRLLKFVSGLEGVSSWHGGELLRSNNSSSSESNSPWVLSRSEVWSLRLLSLLCRSELLMLKLPSEFLSCAACDVPSSSTLKLATMPVLCLQSTLLVSHVPWLPANAWYSERIDSNDSWLASDEQDVEVTVRFVLQL